MSQKTPHNYFCDIVPFTTIPLTREQFFWYTSDRPISPGTLVSVPLFRRTVHGIVLQCRVTKPRKSTSMQLKKITRIIHKNYCTHEQIALASHIAETTFTSLGTVIAQFYTPPTHARIQDTPTISHTHTKNIPPLTKTTTSLCTDILAQEKYTFNLLRDTQETARDALYLHLIHKILTAQKTAQILFLLPEILLAEQIASALRTYFNPDEIVVVHNKIAKGTLWRTHQAIRNNTARIIIGTKKALFQPFAHLRLVIVDEEHDISFKQWDRAPRFDARSVAQTLARIHNCQLVAVSAAPRITKKVPTPLGPEFSSASIHIIDMRAVHFERVKEAQKKKRKKPAPALFSPTLIEAIRSAIARKKQSLLFFNHKGMSAFSLCTDCGALLACPDCDRALVLTAEGHYECFHCTYTTSIFPQCTHCKNMSFRNIGYGTSKIENMLTKLFPTARIVRIDGHSMRATHAATEILKKCEDEKIDIIIGTQMALKDWRNPHLSVVGIIDADALLSIPDISADERLFAFISNATAAVTHKNAENGTVFVQTYKPDYHLFSYTKTLNYTAFRKDTLAERKLLHYPPYWRVIKLIFQHKDKDKANAYATTWHTKITKCNTKNAWRVSDPHTPLLSKRRGLYRYQIIIRIPNKTKDTAPLPETLSILLRATPPRTIIDVDPISIV